MPSGMAGATPPSGPPGVRARSAGNSAPEPCRARHAFAWERVPRGSAAQSASTRRPPGWKPTGRPPLPAGCRAADRMGRCHLRAVLQLSSSQAGPASPAACTSQRQLLPSRDMHSAFPRCSRTCRRGGARRHPGSGAGPPGRAGAVSTPLAGRTGRGGGGGRRGGARARIARGGEASPGRRGRGCTAKPSRACRRHAVGRRRQASKPGPSRRERDGIGWEWKFGSASMVRLGRGNASLTALLRLLSCSQAGWHGRNEELERGLGGVQCCRGLTGNGRSASRPRGPGGGRRCGPSTRSGEGARCRRSRLGPRPAGRRRRRLWRCLC
jgi:hypothetical protein